jgi:hypothetical protein
VASAARWGGEILMRHMPFANNLGLEAMSNVEFTRRWLIAYCLFARL